MPYSPRFEQAWLYAHRLHRDQHRKSIPIPYITHLMSVAGIVADYGGEEDQVIAALLHDVVEDQGGARLVEIRAQFGERVAAIVAGCTEADVIPKPPWRGRKTAFIARLSTTPADALLVVAADKLHNARTLVADLRCEGNSAFEKFNGKQEGTLWFYRELVKALRARGDHPLYDELVRTVQEMDELAAKKVTPKS